MSRLCRLSGRSNWWLAAVVMVCGMPSPPVVAESGTLPEYDRVRILAAARTIRDADLTDQVGRPFRLSNLHGRVALVLFGFTNCPDVCPMAMAKMRLLEKSGQIDPEKIAYVLISVDGERDTPSVMKAFLEKYSPQFIGLTAEPHLVKPIAKEFSAAFYKGNPVGKDNNYSVSHSQQIFALDPAGQLRAEFYNASIEAMAGVTLALLQEAQVRSELKSEQ